MSNIKLKEMEILVELSNEWNGLFELLMVMDNIYHPDETTLEHLRRINQHLMEEI